MKKLFSDCRGRVCCERHAPSRGSDTWVWDRWRRSTPAEARDWTAFLATQGEAEPCESCQSERDRSNSAT